MSIFEDRKEELLQKVAERKEEAVRVRKVVAIASAIGFAVFLILFIGVYLYINSALKPVNPDNKKMKKIEIPMGSGPTTISMILEKKGIVKNAKIYKYYLKFKNESGFMAGTYKLSPSMTLDQITKEIKSGKVAEKVVMKITIPEGLQIKEIAKILAKKTNRSEKQVMDELNSSHFVKKMMGKFPNLLSDEILNKKVRYPLEGYLFPATYPYTKEKPSVEELVVPMLKKMDEVISEFYGQMEGKYTVHELLTLASVVEEESSEATDRKKIASVFENRMNIGMPLQTDPTILYALDVQKGKVLHKDLEVDSPYNTYKYKGLMPGPIANSGVTSIDAVLNPTKTDFLYFVTALETGEAIFAKTLDQHNKNVAKYLK
ncbi:MAG: mltG [Bacillales bacterium]|jgi:UPF0755 protein|nr:mltG [Bacillales bacterium]